MGKAIRRVEGWIRQQATTAQSLKRAGILPVIVAGGSFVLAWPLELCGAIHPWLAWGRDRAYCDYDCHQGA